MKPRDELLYFRQKRRWSRNCRKRTIEAELARREGRAYETAGGLMTRIQAPPDRA
jgi:hypothetical protein